MIRVTFRFYPVNVCGLFFALNLDQAPMDPSARLRTWRLIFGIAETQVPLPPPCVSPSWTNNTNTAIDFPCFWQFVQFGNLEWVI